MRWWVGFGAGALVSACSLITDLSPLGDDGGLTPDATAGDAAADAASEVSPTGFELTVAPAHLTMDVGDSFPVEVTIARGAQFGGLVKVGINGAPSSLAATALTILAGATTGTFDVTLSSLPAQPDFEVTVFGASSDGNETSNAPLGIHQGSLLVDTTSDVAVTVPPFASSIVVKLWGAGGGGGNGLIENLGSYANVYSGGAGGGGGFAGATLAVTPGETLQLAVGGGGAAPSGGGGLSGVFRGTAALLLAGGGGGGTSALQPCTGYGIDGFSGAGGGGSAGQTASHAGPPGTQTNGGAGVGPSAGTALQGGSGGPTPTGPGAAHGGGAAGVGDCNGTGGGGGGGGYFGGAGGAHVTGSPGLGGGGGSGYFESTAKAPQLVAGAGAKAADATDSDCADAGKGGGAGSAQCNPYCVAVNPGAGNRGHVVVRLSKP